MTYSTYRLGNFKGIYLHKKGYNFRGSITETAENVLSMEEFKKELKSEGIDLERKNLYRCSVEHGNNITLLDYSTSDDLEHLKVAGINIYRPYRDSDSIITSDLNCTLLLTTADCLPIIIVDTKQDVFGLVHAGWKGVINDVVVKTVAKMQKMYESKLEDIQIQIGPHISFRDFWVDDSHIKDKFVEYLISSNLIPKKSSNHKGDFGKYVTVSKTFLYNINLTQIVIDKLINFGIPRENIFVDEESTYSAKDENGKPKYHSYRRDYTRSGRNPMIVFYDKMDKKN